MTAMWSARSTTPDAVSTFVWPPDQRPSGPAAVAGKCRGGANHGGPNNAGPYPRPPARGEPDHHQARAQRTSSWRLSCRKPRSPISEVSRNAARRGGAARLMTASSAPSVAVAPGVRSAQIGERLTWPRNPTRTSSTIANRLTRSCSHYFANFATSRKRSRSPLPTAMRRYAGALDCHLPRMACRLPSINSG